MIITFGGINIIPKTKQSWRDKQENVDKIMNNYKIFTITLIGIAISQIISTYHVYMANIQLADQVQYLQANGYFVVPNILVLPQLQSFDTAFIGGLFFTGTIGLGIISISLFISWFWINITQKKKIFLFIIFLQWILSIYYANMNGLSEFSLYLGIMLPLLFAIILVMSEKSIQFIPNPKLFWCLPIIFMFIVGFGTGRSVSFLSIRDYLLLPNGLGYQLNDLYYRYTLYPGEIIKPFALKQQKTCFIYAQRNDAKRYIKAVERKCILYDYLPVSDEKMADLVLKIEPPQILFQVEKNTVVKADVMIFLRETKSIFTQFSEQTDVNDFFRMCILLSLVLCVPILLYIIMMHGLLGLFYLMRIPAFVCQWLVVGIMFVLIGMVILQMPETFSQNASQKDWQHALKNAYHQKDWRKAVVLLQENHFTQTRDNYQLALKWLHQTNHPVLKYWLIRFLSDSKISTDKAIFLNYLSDPNINVVCQALYALGRQRDRNLIPPIQTFVKDCPHWYLQMYAYRALKRLGWRNYPHVENK
jgi:hypothetical protein